LKFTNIQHVDRLLIIKAQQLSNKNKVDWFGFLVSFRVVVHIAFRLFS